MKFKNFIQAGLFVALTVVAASCSKDDDNTVTPIVPVAGTSGSVVDLGLTSGTLWADHNVGATKSSDAGNYYGFGDPTGNIQTMVNTDYYQYTTPTLDSLFKLNRGDKDQVGKLDTTVVKTWAFSDVDQKYSSQFITFKMQRDIIVDSLEIVAETKKAAMEAAYKQQEASRGGDSATFANDSIAYWAAWDEWFAANKNLKYYQQDWVFDQMPALEKALKDKDNQYVYMTDAGINVAYNDTTWEYSGNDMTDFAVDNICGNASYDPATKAWGSEWCMPTKAQLDELVAECVWKLDTENGVAGYRVTSAAEGNTNSIFLPFSGYRIGSEILGQGSDAYYWSGTVNGSYSFPDAASQVGGATGSLTVDDQPCTLMISKQTSSYDAAYKAYTKNLYYGICEGLCVRPVQNKK